MKHREGFVSNSSSSSFLIYGTAFDNYCSWDEWEEFTSKLDKTFLDFQLGEENYNQYIGLSWSSVEDDETANQFKEKIEKELKRILPDKELSFGTHEEAWRDG